METPSLHNRIWLPSGASVCTPMENQTKGGVFFFLLIRLCRKPRFWCSLVLHRASHRVPAKSPRFFLATGQESTAPSVARKVKKALLGYVENIQTLADVRRGLILHKLPLASRARSGRLGKKSFWLCWDFSKGRQNDILLKIQHPFYFNDFFHFAFLIRASTNFQNAIVWFPKWLTLSYLQLKGLCHYEGHWLGAAVPGWCLSCGSDIDLLVACLWLHPMTLGALHVAI